MCTSILTSYHCPAPRCDALLRHVADKTICRQARHGRPCLNTKNESHKKEGGVCSDCRAQKEMEERERERRVKKMSATDAGGKYKAKNKREEGKQVRREVRKGIEAPPPPPPPPMYTYHVPQPPPQQLLGKGKLIEGARNRPKGEKQKLDEGEGKMVWGAKGRYG